MPDGLTCGNHRVAAQDGDEDDDRMRASTRNVTDLRRARQRARRVLRDLEDELNEFLLEHGVERVGRSRRQQQQLNEAITRLAASKLSSDLVQWLARRRQRTMGRAVRAAMDRMQSELGDQFRRDTADFTPAEQSLNRTITQVDAGLLAGTDAVGDADDSLASEIGNDVTRQIRLGVSQNEQVRSTDPDELDIGDRVEMVLTDGDHPKRQEAGVTGQTKKTKAELIAHDSIQQAYTNAATRRYLSNGFRYVLYDAVCDFITSDLCRRLGECDGPAVLIDLTETPWLVPPNHPWCYLPDTSVLTGGGFKPFPALDGTERLFTLDAQRNIHLEHPERYIKRPYSGEMVHIQTNDFDLAVTPNHETPYVSDWKAKNHDDPPLERKRVDDLSGGDRIPRTGDWAGKTPDTVTVAGDEYPTGDFMEFLGWFVADGSATTEDGYTKATITKHREHYPEVHDRIATVTGDLLGGDEWVSDTKVGFSGPLAAYLSTLGNSPDRHIPTRFKQLGPSAIRRLLDGALATDGHVRPGGAATDNPQWDYEFNSERVYYTSSSQLADDIGELILKCGNRPSFYFPNDDRYGRSVEHANGVYETKHPAIAVRECRNDNYAHKPDRVSREPYQGFVYCVTMPDNPTIFVRRNGKCTWSGNCRSGVRPTLNRRGQDAVAPDDIADDYLQTIMSTEQYRPMVMDVDRELNRTALQRVAEGGVG